MAARAQRFARETETLYDPSGRMVIEAAVSSSQRVLQIVDGVVIVDHER